MHCTHLCEQPQMVWYNVIAVDEIKCPFLAKDKALHALISEINLSLEHLDGIAVSKKKKKKTCYHNTAKFLIGITPQCVVTFVSK